MTAELIKGTKNPVINIIIIYSMTIIARGSI